MLLQNFLPDHWKCSPVNKITKVSPQTLVFTWSILAYRPTTLVTQFVLLFNIEMLKRLISLPVVLASVVTDAILKTGIKRKKISTPVSCHFGKKEKETQFFFPCQQAVGLNGVSGNPSNPNPPLPGGLRNRLLPSAQLSGWIFFRSPAIQDANGEEKWRGFMWECPILKTSLDSIVWQTEMPGRRLFCAVFLWIRLPPPGEDGNSAAKERVCSLITARLNAKAKQHRKPEGATCPPQHAKKNVLDVETPPPIF